MMICYDKYLQTARKTTTSDILYKYCIRNTYVLQCHGNIMHHTPHTISYWRHTENRKCLLSSRKILYPEFCFGTFLGTNSYPRIFGTNFLRVYPVRYHTTPILTKPTRIENYTHVRTVKFKKNFLLSYLSLIIIMGSCTLCYVILSLLHLLNWKQIANIHITYVVVKYFINKKIILRQ